MYVNTLKGTDNMAEEEKDTFLESLAEAAAAAEKEETKPVEAEEKEDESTESEQADDVEQEQADDAEEVDTVSEEPEKPSKKSASDTIRALKAERNAERAEREKLIAERATYAAQLEELRQQKQAQASAAERKAEEDRLALLDPAERTAYEANKRAQSLEHRLNLMQMQMQDATERAVFQSQAAHDPLIAKYKDQVEQMLEEDRKKGFSAPREAYLDILVGRAVRQESAKALIKKKESASKRIDAATSKPASARGDVAGSKKGKSEEDRLRGVLI